MAVVGGVGLGSYAMMSMGAAAGTAKPSAVVGEAFMAQPTSASSAFDGSHIADSKVVESQVDDILDNMNVDDALNLSQFFRETPEEEMLEAVKRAVS